MVLSTCYSGVVVACMGRALPTPAFHAQKGGVIFEKIVPNCHRIPIPKFHIKRLLFKSIGTGFGACARGELFYLIFYR